MFVIAPLHVLAVPWRRMCSQSIRLHQTSLHSVAVCCARVCSRRLHFCSREGGGSSLKGSVLCNGWVSVSPAGCQDVAEAVPEDLAEDDEKELSVVHPARLR